MLMTTAAAAAAGADPSVASAAAAAAEEEEPRRRLQGHPNLEAAASNRWRRPEGVAAEARQGSGEVEEESRPEGVAANPEDLFGREKK